MHETEPIAYVVDDDEAVRDAIQTLLRAAGMRVEVFTSGAAFIKEYRGSEAGCLILDIRMPGLSGLEVQDELYKRRFRLPIIFLTGHADVAMAVRAMKRGAFDFIEKPLDSRRLVVAALNALRFDSEQRRSTLATASAPEALSVRLASLSEREREVLEMVLEGIQTRVIANNLNIAIKTVEFHRSRIREKLGVTSLAALFNLFR